MEPCPVVNASTRRHRWTPRHSRITWSVWLIPLFSCLAAPTRGQDDPAVEDPLPGTQTEVTVTERGRVEMHVADLPLATVLQLLSVQSQRNIIASPKVTGTVTANLYNITFEEALEAILITNGAGYRTDGNFIYVHSKEELAAMAAQVVEKPVTRVFQLNYIAAADASTYIQPLLGEEDTVTASPSPESGLSSSSSAGGGQGSAAGDFLVVTAPPDTIREVERILTELDVRPRQVLIEATILRAELTDDNSLGIDFTLVGGVDLELLGANSNGLVDVNLGALPQDRFERFNAMAMTGFTSDMPSGGVSVGIIKDNVGVFLRALEQVTDTTVLANPKVLALNKQKGQVIVGRRDGFMTTTVTETQAIQSVEFLETGTQLIFRPFISNDGFIRVELHPEDSVGFVNAQGLPSEQTTEVTTNVIVRDGETILIGGLFREVTTDARSQVPWLGSLPGIGALFRSNDESTAREEVIILMTIKIVKDRAAYAAASHDQFEDIERMRVGLRQGLMWHGRDRLAQRHYHRALSALTAGDKEKALWHTKLALHNNARMVAAIRLKEKILGERAWNEDGAVSREFIHRLIAREKGLAGGTFDRPVSQFEDAQPNKPTDKLDENNPGS